MMCALLASTELCRGSEEHYSGRAPFAAWILRAGLRPYAGPATVDSAWSRAAPRTTFRPAFFRYESPALGFVPGKGMLGGEPRLDVLPGVFDEIAPSLELLDTLIDPIGFALGRFTIADAAAAPILFRTTKTGLDLEPFPNLVNWRETLLARPAFAAADPVT